MRKQYAQLSEALAAVAEAKACIAGNRGYDKELAREAHEHAVGELGEATVQAVILLVQDLESKDVVRLAKYVDGLVERAQ